MCCIVYAIMAHFRALFSPSSMPPPPDVKAFLDRSHPKEHTAVNRMPKFKLGKILRLVKNRHFWLVFSVSSSSSSVCRQTKRRSLMNFLYSFSILIPRDIFARFSKFLFFHENFDFSGKTLKNYLVPI